MKLVLTRYPSGQTETQGYLIVPPLRPYYTMEQEWNATKKYPSGVPANSCVPFGTYALEPFTRPDGTETWCMVNPDLNVHMYDKVDEASRTLCILHKGNFSYDTKGCILPGLSHRQIYSQKTERVMPAVGESNPAMGYIQDALGVGSTGHTLEIVPIEGWKNLLGGTL